MEYLRNSKYVVKRYAENLEKVEKEFTLSLLQNKFKGLRPELCRDIAIAARFRATKEIFEEHPGGICNSEYFIKHGDARMQIVMKHIQEVRKKACDHDPNGDVQRRWEVVMDSGSHRVARGALVTAQIDSRYHLKGLAGTKERVQFTDMQLHALKCIEEVEIWDSKEKLKLLTNSDMWGPEMKKWIKWRIWRWRSQGQKIRPRRNHRLPRKSRKERKKIENNMANWIELSGTVKHLMQTLHLKEIEPMLRHIFGWKETDLFAQPFRKFSQEELMLLEPQVDLEDDRPIVNAQCPSYNIRKNA